MSPKRIAAELARIGRHPYLAEAREVPEGSGLDKVRMILRSAVGFQYALQPGGFLCLGNAESIGDYSDAFTPEDQSA